MVEKRVVGLDFYWDLRKVDMSVALPAAQKVVKWA